MRSSIIAVMLCILCAGCATSKSVWEERPIGKWEMVHQWDISEQPIPLKGFSLTLKRDGTFRSTWPATGDQGTYALDRKRQQITMSHLDKSISIVMQYYFQQDYMTLTLVGFRSRIKGKDCLDVHSPYGFIMKWVRE